MFDVCFDRTLFLLASKCLYDFTVLFFIFTTYLNIYWKNISNKNIEFFLSLQPQIKNKYFFSYM